MTYTSLFDKLKSNEIQLIPEVTFYSVFLALISMAGSEELDRLERAFPEVVQEAKTRYHAPGGALSVDEWLEYYALEGEPPSREYLERQFRHARVMAATTYNNALDIHQG